MYKRQWTKMFFTLMVIIVFIMAVLFVAIPSDINIIIKIIISAIVLVISIVIAIVAVRLIKRKIDWYEAMLDSIPFPISVTDMDMNWTFVNKPVEDFLGIKRVDVLGKQCSNWDAHICNTADCGIACLRSGKERTFFTQSGFDFQVDVHYLLDDKGRRTGHIEVVQDISTTSKTLKSQQSLIEEIDTVSKAFLSASNYIAQEAFALAQGSTEQSATAKELSVSISEVFEHTLANTEMAAKAADLAAEIRENAEMGSSQMARMTQAVEEISHASQAISNVIKIIDDIAFQTNILALNASVEAARAGQHGKGFAVVSTEVRNLAEKSAAAARDTAALIEESIQKAKVGVSISAETAESLEKIVDGINTSVELMKNITESSELQTNAINHINSGINQFEAVVTKNSGTAEQNAASAEEITSQASMLKNLIDSFRVDD